MVSRKAAKGQRRKGFGVPGSSFIRIHFRQAEQRTTINDPTTLSLNFVKIMHADDGQFEIEYERQTVLVQSHLVGGQTIFRIMLPDKPPLILTRSATEDDKPWWTSVPEGRQQEADSIGPLIEKYYSTKNK